MGARAVFAISLVVAGLASGRAGGETLTEALAKAYGANPALLAERAKLRAVDEGVPQALANWRPEVKLSAEAGSSSVTSTASTGTNRYQHRDPKSLSLTIDQPLYRGGRTVAETQEAEFKVQAARARLDSVEQGVLLDAATAFMNVVRDQAVVELNVGNEQVLSRHLEATRDQFRVGEITRTDVSQSEARLATATAQRIAAEGNLDASRAAYRNVVGEAPGRLDQPALPTDLPRTVDEVLKETLRADPDVIATEFDERAQGQTVELVRGELLPTVSLEGTASRSLQSSSETSALETYEAQVVLSIPLYQQGDVYSRLRGARQTLAQRSNLAEDSRREATRAAASAWAALQSARAQIGAFRTAIEANQVALEGVQREAQVGSRTVLDVLDAEQELLDSRVGLVRAQRDLTVAIFQLKATLGRMTAAALDLPVDRYDPLQHYEEVRGKWTGGHSSGEAAAPAAGQ